MTDKQIIIDGVDVSGCSFFDIHYLKDEDVEIKNFCRIVHCDCDSYPNCYYKQLKRKEQECKKWKNAYEVKEDALAESEEYCEELEEQYNKLKAKNDELKGIRDRNFLHALEERKRADKLSKTLIEIKEIAEKEVKYRMLFADKKSFCDFNKILQKISECEVE